MSTAALAMIIAGVATLVAGIILVRERFSATYGLGKLAILGPVFEAVSLAIFAAEHFFLARDLSGIVPRWLPFPLFWTYFVGIALLAAAISFIAWRHVRWSASLLAALFLIIVITIDLPALPKHIHERLFWTLTLRETAFAAGAIVLAGSQWIRDRPVGATLMTLGRSILSAVFIFYAIEHFLFPHNVPGVPLEKLTPTWIPAATLISFLVGAVLLISAFGLLLPRTRPVAAASSGGVLVILVVFFYIPILVTEINTPLAVEGVNYVGDTLLFAATALLAGFTADWPTRYPSQSVFMGPLFSRNDVSS